MSALGYVVRKTGDDHAGKASHAGKIPRTQVNGYAVTGLTREDIVTDGYLFTEFPMTVALDRIGVHSTIPIPRKLLQYVCRSFIFQVENGIFPPICCHRDCHNHGGRRNPGRAQPRLTNEPSI